MAKKPAYEELEQRVKDLEMGAAQLIPAEEQVAKQRMLFDDIIELNPYSIQICDRERHHVRGNRAFVELFKEAPPPEYPIFDDPNPKKAGFQKLVRRAKGGETVRLPKIWYNHHDIKPENPDKLVCIRIVIYALSARNSEIENFVLMHENITERKRVELSLIARERKVKEAQQLGKPGNRY